jgi:2-(1,2-epoxy-1,2-dihydrophenyl)acetyl-CoA isomerase
MAPTIDRVIDTGTDTVTIEVSGRVGVIRFARPERRNALHDEMFAPMLAAIEEFVADPQVGCVVLTGEGSAFCAGGDVRDGMGRRTDGTKPTRDERIANLAANAQLSVVLRESPIVTIAAVNGSAVGAGMALALACDLRIAAASAKFIGGWARLGFSGDFGGPWLLARRIGEARALEMLVTNATVHADEALRLGMVDRVVPDAEFGDAWRAWAAVFASSSKTATGYLKQNLANASIMSIRDAIALESQFQVDSSLTDDHREGVRAWVERREPNFGP